MTSEGIQERITPTGLRVVTEHIPGFQSVAFGVFFRQGSRDEDERVSGTSHLIEHMLFKGTRGRSSKEILAEIERLGGISDGFTAKEIMGLTIRCLADTARPLLEIIFEMLTDSSFDEAELAKEKEVIYEEMRSAREDPQDTVFDRFFEACFSPHSLGRSVLGSQDKLSAIDSRALHDIYRKKYTLADSIMVAVGDVAAEDFISYLPAKIELENGERKERPSPDFKASAESLVHTRSDISQVYVVMGTHTSGLNSEERFALALLATLMGGGMSSRLFSLLREDKGYVYTVSSFLELFEDSGVTGFYYITEKSKLAKVFAEIEGELKRLLKKGIKTNELETAKTLTKSFLLLNMENLSHRMMRLGHWKLLSERFRTIPETIASFERVTPDDILAAAEKYLDFGKFHTSFVGPVSRKDTGSLTRR